MYMMNVVGNLKYLESTIKDLLDIGSVELTDSLSQIENNTFIVNINSENIEKTMEFNNVTGFENRDIKELNSIADNLKDIFKIDLRDERLKREYNEDEIKDFYGSIKSKVDKIYDCENQIDENKKELEDLYLIEDLDVSIESLCDMKYFDYRFGYLSKENRLKLKKNYDNIMASVLHLASKNKKEVYVAIYPKDVSIETDRILRSLNWTDININKNRKEVPKEIISKIELENENLGAEISELNQSLNEIYRDNKSKIIDMVISANLLIQLEDVKSLLGRSENYFYLAGWVPESAKSVVQEKLSAYDDMFINFLDADDSGLTPPTKLKNNKFFKPFELLVNMYGTPNYKEIDPTVFFGLTYMLLFGAMFGDLGQGAVMFVAGVLLAKFKDKMMGGLLERIGASSMVFGILYGSFFGLEGIIPALFLKPFENINKVLIIAIGLGVVLLLIAYILGLCNNYIFKDVQEGLFGQEGLAGFLLFLLFLLLAATVALELHIVSVGVIAACMLIVIFVMIFKVPLTQLLYKRRPLHNGLDVTGYYVESSFSIIETLISMFSSTVSFIRVGAFAINHVGLFLAFTSIGKMIGTNAGNIAMIIVGNIVILGLEGLIVFIQSLRLEYYELFSKYFKGDGILFQPTIKRI